MRRPYICLKLPLGVPGFSCPLKHFGQLIVEIISEYENAVDIDYEWEGREEREKAVELVFNAEHSRILAAGTR